MRLPRSARLTAVSSAVLLSVGLSACSTEDSPEPDGTSEPTQTTSPTATPSTTATSPAAPETGSSERTTTERATDTTTSESGRGLPRDVAEVQEIFSPVAPDSLFAEFDSCNPSGISNAWECSGREVGQFQFFESMAKAASTTQLITELRSSRVVEDTGRKVVGWSTLGTTAVITVVDNDKGLVMQQMVSSDRVDPEERIYELGLAERPTSTETDVPSETETTGADEAGS